MHGLSAATNFKGSPNGVRNKIGQAPNITHNNQLADYLTGYYTPSIDPG